MDFIESFFGISPDGGTGAIEFALVAASALTLASLAVAHRRFGPIRRTRSYVDDSSVALGAVHQGHGVLFGIDPFSGIVQTTYTVPFSAPSAIVTSEEAEGLDIIDDTTDVGLTWGAPEIEVQILANELGTDQWAGVHIHVNDPSRL